MSLSIAQHGVVGLTVEASDKGDHWLDIIVTDDKGDETEMTLFLARQKDREELKVKLLEQLKDAATTALQELDNAAND